MGSLLNSYANIILVRQYPQDIHLARIPGGQFLFLQMFEIVPELPDVGFVENGEDVHRVHLRNSELAYRGLATLCSVST